MSTKARTIGIAGRPTGFVIWTGIVSALAAAALIMSAVALIEARDHGSIAGATSKEQVVVASAQAPSWDAGKLEAMQGRVLAESVGSDSYVLWDDGKLAARRAASCRRAQTGRATSCETTARSRRRMAVRSPANSVHSFGCFQTSTEICARAARIQAVRTRSIRGQFAA
jgi:hypothetical protein